MAHTMTRPTAVMEVNEVDRPLAAAKARVGRCVREAIGASGFKVFGDKGLLSRVVTGEKVPAYLARIYQDEQARRRLGLALLQDDPRVRVRMVIECECD